MWLCCIWIGAFCAGSLHGFCRFALLTFLSGNLWVLAERCAVLHAWLAYTDIFHAIAVVLGVSFELGSVTPFASAANLVLVLWCTSLLCSRRKMGGSAVSHWTLVFSCFSCYLGTSSLAWVWSFFVCIYVGFCCICGSWALATSPCGFFVLAFAFALARRWLLCPFYVSSVPAAHYCLVSLCSQHDKGRLVIFGSFLHSSPSSNICCGPMILQPHSHLSDSRPACSLFIRAFPRRYLQLDALLAYQNGPFRRLLHWM